MAPWSEDATLGSGLPDRFKATIRTARADTPYEKAPDVVAVVFDFEREFEGEIEDDHFWLKPGAFEPGDKPGTFLVHTKQKPSIFDEPGTKKTKINRDSSYGKFLNSLFEVVGMEEVEKLQDPERSKYEIWDLMIWDGLILDIEMVDEPYSFTDKKTKEKVEGKSRQPYVRAFLGKADGSVSASAPAASEEAPAATTNGSSNGKVTPAECESYMDYLTKYVSAGGDPGDPEAKQEFFEANKAGASA